MLSNFPSETAWLSNKAPLVADQSESAALKLGSYSFFNSACLRIVHYHIIESGRGVGWGFGITSELSGVLLSCLGFSFASLSRMN